MVQINSVSSKRAFTTIELLVVVAIIGILAVGVSQIDFNGMSARQKRDRMVNGVVTLIRNEITKNSTGKAIRQVGGVFAYPTKTLVILDTESIRAEYYSGSTILSNTMLVTKPFYGDEKYTLVSGTGTIIGGGTTGFTF